MRKHERVDGEVKVRRCSGSHEKRRGGSTAELRSVQEGGACHDGKGMSD